MIIDPGKMRLHLLMAVCAAALVSGCVVMARAAEPAASEAKDLGQDIASDLAAPLKSIWEYELYRDDSRHYQLTVKAICVALVIAVCGTLLAGRVTRRVGRAVSVRAHLDARVTASIEKIVYYGLLVLVALFALHMVNIPLTAFTLLGGALAIGVGFGTQNLMSNFMSGLILLIERPIRINDVIDVAGERGRIVNIGLRCCRVHTFNGVDVLVPNSTFLNQNVVNWTLSDPQARVSVRVRVSFGWPIEQIKKLFLQAANEHTAVLTHPEPFVLLDEFVDNGMVFEVCFWIEFNPKSDPRVVCSEVRFRIEELFREAGIAMMPGKPEDPKPPPPATQPDVQP